MKKAILILLCLVMLGGAVSCDTSNHIDFGNGSAEKNLEKNDDDTDTSDSNNVISDDTNTTYNSTNNEPNEINSASNKNQSMRFSNLHFYDMRSSYDAFYINRSPIAKYAVTDDLKLCVYIQEWDEYLIFPLGYERYLDLINCVSIYENNGILINEAHKKTNDLNVFLFSKGNDEIVECNISLDRTIHISGLYCEFSDESNGYIFVFEEVFDPSINGGTRLAFLLKTHNGGKTWTETAINNSPIVSCRENPCIAEFIDDNIGIISCRYGGSEDMCQRTFFTFDGGKTWETMSALPYNFSAKDGYDATQIADFLYVDGEYWLDVKVRSDGGNSTYYLRFKSLDLNSWILVE